MPPNNPIGNAEAEIEGLDASARSDLPDAPRAAGAIDGLPLDVLARASPDAVLILDPDWRVVYANPAYCALRGYPLDQILGRDIISVVPERDRQTVRTHLSDIRAGRCEPLLAVTSRADGSPLELEVIGSTLDLQGRQFVIVFIRDVTERQRQARRAAALAQVAASVVASDSIAAVLDAISECALSGTSALAAWVTLDEEDEVAAWVGAAGVPDGFREQARPAASTAAACSFFQQSLAAQRIAVYGNARQQAERELGTACIANALKSLPWQTAAFAPLRYRGAPIGLLTAIYRVGEMPYQAETNFLAALADHAAMAAVNARLLAATRERIALEERQRLARELHDSVYQSLYAIQLGARMARERLGPDQAGIVQPIDYVLRLAEASQAEMRALLFELRPESLEAEGLVAAIDKQVEALRARHCIAAQATTSAEPDLPIDVKRALFRIAQEALCNTAKHARARRVAVHLEADEAAVVLEVSDDGVGFDPAETFSGHLGLRSMRERATGAGGSLQVVSAHGRGTRVVVRVPSTPQAPPRRASMPGRRLAPGRADGQPLRAAADRRSHS